MACRGVEHSEANHIPDEGRLAAKPTGDLSFGISAIVAFALKCKITFVIIQRDEQSAFHSDGCGDSACRRRVGRKQGEVPGSATGGALVRVRRN